MPQNRSSRAICSILFALTGFYLTSPVSAQSTQDLSDSLTKTGRQIDCRNGRTAEIIIAACTKLISGGGDARDDVAGYYLSRGKAYMASQKLDAAINDFTLALNMQPGNADALEYRGILRIGKAEDAPASNPQRLTYLRLAKADLDQSIASNPNDARSYHFRGLSEFLIGTQTHDDALAARAAADNARAKQIDPNFGN